MNSSSQVATITPSFKALASVTPPVAASKCTTPATFTYSGILTATAPGTVKYQWVYSSGKPGPVQTGELHRAGHKTVTGETVKTKKAGTGWAELKMVSPVGRPRTRPATSCCATSGRRPGQRVRVRRSARGHRTCPATPPTLTATGSITAPRPATVTYYWALSNGHELGTRDPDLHPGRARWRWPR